jgi:3-isopropylmalate/(R)-2-methylmalate dehydratase small subunit
MAKQKTTHFQGKVFRFGDDINTDFIISGRYKFAISDMKELSQYLFEDIRPNFYKEITPGKSVIVAGNNFGMGSSREQAPWVIKEAGVNCVIAKSFARIFYRNAFNIGLPLIELNTDSLGEGDQVEINLDKGSLIKQDTKQELSFPAFDEFRKRLISCGGILNYLKKYKDLKLPE